MEQLLQYTILIPFAGYLLSLIPSNKKETAIFRISSITVFMHLLSSLALTASWFAQGRPYLFHESLKLYETNESSFTIDFFFDRNTAVFSIVSGIIVFLVTVFSRYYMHREKGYKRFYNNLLFFYLGLNFILYAGNFETLFVGWEIIGVTSFFLIAFYRERYLPVKNAIKVISVYRLADIFLLLAIWVSHHYFKSNIDFLQLANLRDQHIRIITDNSFQLSIFLMFLIVALVKSAQFPFSSWLPRAMEGPTTSSAVFYGSLSVHMGVFLLIRTYPYWGDSWTLRTVVLLIGVITAVVATFIARVQSGVKTQIAYSSIAQIGIMFIEVAMGWHVLALVHFVCNAFLRTYQLLVSPSALSYMIHEQFFNFIPPANDMGPGLWGRIKYTVFVLGIKEFNLDTFMYQWLWKPMKSIGILGRFKSSGLIVFLLMPLYLVGLYYVYHKPEMSPNTMKYLPPICAFIGLALILRAFTVRDHAAKAWTLVIMNQLFMVLAIAFNEQFSFHQIHLYLSGILVSGVLGYGCLLWLNLRKEKLELNKFHGHVYRYPKLTILFLIACLGVTGFPITPTFIGEDLILGHIHENQFLLTALIALGLILDGLAIFRLYARLFLGPGEGRGREVAYRSA
jgi:NADH-quinone oxidoreductase subunit L